MEMRDILPAEPKVPTCNLISTAYKQAHLAQATCMQQITSSFYPSSLYAGADAEHWKWSTADAFEEQWL